MASKSILACLQDANHIESDESRQLRLNSIVIIKSEEESSNSILTESRQNSNNLPGILHELLTAIIRPLFSKSQHPSLTATGRKNLHVQSLTGRLPTSTSAFSILDDSANAPWKNGWTISLLQHVLSQYTNITPADHRRKTLESHFYLLVPPTLHLLDDMDITYKTLGCSCMRLLCDNLRSAESDMLQRTGMSEVFVDALKDTFHLLPTLTPIEESVTFYTEMYPCYNAVIGARFPPLTDTTKKASSTRDKDQILKSQHLTLLLRHQLLHTLTHLGLSPSTCALTMTSLPLAILLLRHIPQLFEQLGPSSAIPHLQATLPLLRTVLSDAFTISTPDLILATTEAMHGVVQTCWMRIRGPSGWWADCLRGLVTCWLNVLDEEKECRPSIDGAKLASLRGLKDALRRLVMLLEDVGASEVKETRDVLVHADEDLKGLFTS